MARFGVATAILPMMDKLYALIGTKAKRASHISTAFIMLLLAFSAVARCEERQHEMQFTAYPPDSFYRLAMNDPAWRIFANGELDPQAGERLTALIRAKRISGGSILYLNSPGGSLVGGIALGRAIRTHGLNTSIGRYDPNLKYKGAKPGFCYSACATAFLGGEFRYLNEGSVYGVHRFFSNAHSDSDSDVAQIVSAALVEYIRSMGVDPKIFELASQAGAADVITPSHEVLLALNVVNDGRKPPKWTIESLPRAVYLKGEQETDNGLDKFIIACPVGGAGSIFLQALFDGGSNAQQTIAFPVSWLFIDDNQISMDRELDGKEISKGGSGIILTYRLNASLLATISKAKTVGVGLQPSVSSPIFAGFNHLPFADGAAKLPGLLGVCSKGVPPH